MSPGSPDLERLRITLDHVGIATEDGIESALERLEAIFPVQPSACESVPGEGVRVAFLELGPARLELLESLRPDSAIARFLERRQAGVHHLSFRVEGVSLADWYEHLKSRGVRVLGDGPREGSGGTRVFFVHPSSSGGVLIEFSQRAGED